MDSTISTRPSPIEIDDVIAILRCYYLDNLVLVNETFLQDLRFLLQAKGATFIEPLNQSRSLSEVPFQDMEPKSGWHFDNVISLDFDIEGHQILPPDSNDDAEKKVIPNLNENVLPKLSAEVPKATALKSILPKATLEDEFISTPNSNVTDTVKKTTPNLKKKKRNECSKCDFQSENRTLLLRHVVAVHAGSFECHICKYKTVSKPDLDKHFSVVHKKNRKFKCSICSFASKEKIRLSEHILRVHEDRGDEVKRQFECFICDYKAVEKGTLQKHIDRVHEGKKKYTKYKYQCTKCNENFNEKNQLTNHALHVHGEKTNTCKICHVGFAFKSLLVQHNITVHGKRGPIRCPNCEATFPLKISLKEHKRSVHDMKMKK